MEDGTAITQPARTSPSSSLVCGPASRPWRRQLGAVAWAALEELAFTSHPDDHGWASPVGVGGIATGIGTTAASAARAVAALCGAGLVVLEPVTDLTGHRRLSYRLHLPDGIELRHCPSQNGHAAQGVHRRCPDDQDARSPNTYAHRQTSQDGHWCPTHQDTVPVSEEAGGDDKQESGGPIQPPRHNQSSGRHTKEHR